MKRVVVIGGTRFMGPHVVRSLTDRGCYVTVVHRGSECSDASHVHTDRLHLPEDLHADVVVDMWCMTGEHARSLIEHFTSERLVVISSADVYRNYDGLRGRYGGPPDPTPLREDAPLRETRYPYRDGRHAVGTDDFLNDYDKIVVEEIVSGPRTAILRLPAVYGPQDEQHRFARWLEAMDNGARTIAVDAGQAQWRWTRGFSRDVAEAIVLTALSNAAAEHVFNVGERDALTEEAWLRLIAEAAGWNGRVEIAESVPGTPPLHFGYDLVVDTTAIRQHLGYRERHTRAAAIAETVAWERAMRSQKA